MVHAALKDTTILFSLSNHYILRREWRVIVDQVTTNYQPGVTELLIMRDPHYARMSSSGFILYSNQHDFTSLDGVQVTFH